MKILLYILTGLCIATGFAACDKFLDVTPKGIILPEKLADYENILNSPEITMSFPPTLLYCTDDFYQDFDALSQAPEANAYYWRRGIDENEQGNPAVWGDLYKSIYHANVIINNVLDAPDGSTAKKQSVKAEALVVRAANYFTLLTVFAKAYDPATAATDPGLPLVTSTDVTEKTPPRASLQATLDSIMSDLKAAVEWLPATNLNRYRVTKQAAYGMLSRVYLYMQQYNDAGANATLALQAPHSILDYNDYTDSYDFPVTDQKGEILLQYGCVADYYIPSFMVLSDDFKTYLNADDLRYTLLTTSNNYGLCFLAPNGMPNFGITYQEMELTQAEAAARAKNVEKAMGIINDFRKYRISKATWKPLSAGSPEEALQLVLAERRREMAFGGLRWMDMKRLDKEGRMPVVKRVNKETGETLATLAPHSEQYTFEIPARVLQFNPDMVKNYK